MSTVNAGIIPDTDIATIISIFPFRLYETKPGVHPASFEISPGTPEAPTYLEIQSAFSTFDFEGSQIKLPVSAQHLANSVIRDLRDSQINIKADSYPGIAAVSGKCTACPPALLAELKAAQTKWFAAVYAQTEADWKQFRSMRAVTDAARYAAKLFNRTPEWLAPDVIAESSKVCPACGTNVPSTAAVCFSCRFVLNSDAYAKMQFATK